jgi:hypothetical protein
MTSLSEVYEGDGRGPGLRRLYLGVGLFFVGALLVVAGIVVASTDLLIGGGMTVAQVRELGAVLGGIGVPAVFLGILTVLPADARTRVAAGIGASIALLGVLLFVHAYPCQWTGSNCGAGLPNLTLPTLGTYFLGAITTFWYLFVGVANFKTRNDPGGTVTMEITKQGETRVVEVERNRFGGFGGIGFLGNDPDGNVETQTNQRLGSGTVSDGGASSNDVRDVGVGRDATAGPTGTKSTAEPRSVQDTYCGNCAHFEYVRTDRGSIQPYCHHHEELMDDMDACDEWAPRR